MLKLNLIGLSTDEIIIVYLRHFFDYFLFFLIVIVRHTWVNTGDSLYLGEPLPPARPAGGSGGVMLPCCLLSESIHSDLEAGRAVCDGATRDYIDFLYFGADQLVKGPIACKKSLSAVSKCEARGGPWICAREHRGDIIHICWR